MDGFSPGVSDKLRHYVYRLIDPRDGNTFYVGRGQGDRAFAHAGGEHASDRDESREDAKMDVLQDIRLAGLRPIHLVHRHGMDMRTARIVEAALIDAYPGLASKVRGVASDKGPRTVEQLEEHYAPRVMQRRPQDMLLIIKTSRRTVQERGSVYRAVSGSWAVSRDRATRADYVLAVVRQVCVGVFRAERWEQWPDSDRCYFHGHEVHGEVAESYLRKRIPSEYRKRGMAAPVLFWPPAGGPAWSTPSD